ncbi:alpha/beta-hydrolase [Mycena metata]|uniref:Carboxypeptidase n=1 Tax=Mycena metata TaxID=1033252 RepID=A0AAD7HIL2_9AGAR|nr:alpha/beta-hydrolase [Mycena metata]
MIPISLFALLLAVGSCSAAADVPNTFPHAYPGMPTTAFGPDWQNYFEVDGLLPNLTTSLTRSFAGNVGVNRANHPNATLFFWAFEKVNGSLTGAAAGTDPWIIWLNGGPGDSSLRGLMTENGPLHVNGDYSIASNNYSWSQLADVVWVDQPVGTGYSTSDTESYVANENQVAQDFLGFLSNMVKIFPSLATRPLYLMGESYAGRYIPYITKAIFSTSNPPVALKKMSIGDGALGSLATFEQLPTLTTIVTYPQLIDYDPDVYNYFKTQEHLCGYDLNLTYPQNGLFPTLESVKALHPTDPLADRTGKSTTRHKVLQANKEKARAMPLSKREVVLREERRQEWKRTLAGRPNGTLDPFYGCRLFEELWDTALNFSSPWKGGSIDVYDIIDALDPPIPSDASVFLNDPNTRAALHAPTSKDWVESFDYPFGGNDLGDPSPEPMVFLSELAANASALGVGIVFYSGNDDSISAHRGTEVVIQNMTFGGIQGFTRKPGTPFQDDQGNFAGIVHQERGLTYALFQNAGHFVAQSAPGAAYAFVRDFVLGSSTTGLVNSDTGTVAGGEDSNLQENVLPGNSAILHWAEGGTTAIASTIAPSATIAAWNAFIATATATGVPVSTGSKTGHSAAAGLGRGGGPWPWGLALVLAAHLF